MDHRLNFIRVGWTVSIFVVLMHVVALIRMSMLSGQTRAFMEQFAALGHPGFSMLNATGVVIMLVEAFVYGWVFSAIFVGLYNGFHKETVQ